MTQLTEQLAFDFDGIAADLAAISKVYAFGDIVHIRESRDFHRDSVEFWKSHIAIYKRHNFELRFEDYADFMRSSTLLAYCEQLLREAITA